MGISLKKREIILISALGILIYILVFVKFVWLPIVPEISTKQIKLSSVLKEKAIMDDKLKNIEITKANLKNKEAYNDRMNDFLFDTANVTDGIETIEKIAKIIGRDMEKVSISKPAEVSMSLPVQQANDNTNTANDNQQKPSGDKYYEFRIACTSNLTFDEAMDLVTYCDSNTKKMTISKFVMTPPEIKNQAVQSQPPPPAVGKVPNVPAPSGAENSINYKVDMIISFYSINVGAASKMYNYTRGKFNIFNDRNPRPFIQPSDDKDGNPIIPSDISDAGGNNSGGVVANVDNTTNSYGAANLVLFEMGYVVGGENFQLFSTETPKQWVRLKTAEKVNVKLSLGGSEYYAEAHDTKGNGWSIKGKLPQSDFQVYAESVVPDVEMNKNITIDIKVANSSNKRVGVIKKDSGSRIRVLDRNGSLITSTSNSEKVYLL